MTARYGANGERLSSKRRRGTRGVYFRSQPGRSPRWVASWAVGAGKRSSKSFATEQEAREWLAANHPNPLEEVKHGTRNAYLKRACRCDECRAANAEYNRQWRDRRAGGVAPEANASLPHGRLATYNNCNCRCEPCSQAMREHKMERATQIRGTEPSMHGLDGYKRFGCRCAVCCAALDEALVKLRRYRAAVQARTLDVAARNGHQWTGPELEIASRADLTPEQAALMLGRTHRAVETVRTRMKRQEPKIMRLLGAQS